MNKKAVVLYLHAHQPWRVKPYTAFHISQDHMYFNDETDGVDTNNKFIIDKVAEKSYVPTNKILKELLVTYPEFRVSLSITGTLLEQLEKWRPDVLKSFQEIVATGKVEIVAETYYHSLAFFYSRAEFVRQVAAHAQKIHDVFGVVPTAFRNTELSYNNQLAKWADEAGYKAIITEGWDPILGWRSANYVYKPIQTHNIKLLMKNYKLSDDVAFRFSDKNWTSWPLNAPTFSHWMSETLYADGGDIINLFMDYETFGEHQWSDTGIFDFLRALPNEWISNNGTFKTITEAAESYDAVDEIDIHNTITWADTERDLTAWTGNAMQQDFLNTLYSIEKEVLETENHEIIQDWQKLTTSDHPYYMCTKWFNDGDVHAYFSPYMSPYDAFTFSMNALRDLQLRIMWDKEKEQ